MPIYEYICLDCDTSFEILRPMREADAPIQCKTCQSEHTLRKISVFAAHSGGKVITGNSGGGCAGCSGGSCSSCGVN